jgi:hypothetical protein
VNLPLRDDSPLDSDEWVLRLAEANLDPTDTHRCSPKAFELSSLEKQQAGPGLSVFAERLTTPEEAWSLGSNPRRTRVFRLLVGEVRRVRPTPESAEMPGLDVRWERAYTTGPYGGQIPDTRPGAEGHAAITGLGRTDLLDKNQRKRVRVKLADAARFVKDIV